jgi:hypothetical protein
MPKVTTSQMNYFVQQTEGYDDLGSCCVMLIPLLTTMQYYAITES